MILIKFVVIMQDYTIAKTLSSNITVLKYRQLLLQLKTTYNFKENAKLNCSLTHVLIALEWRAILNYTPDSQTYDTFFVDVTGLR